MYEITLYIVGQALFDIVKISLSGGYVMRVISGKARGLWLDSVIGISSIRPTTDRIKESIFNIIQFEIHGKCFLDLFGGTGQVGIEAISRGAGKVVIVDCEDVSVSIIKKNVSKLNYIQDIELVKCDAIEYLKNTDKKFDIAFLDPPYKSNLLELSLPLVGKVMNKGGIIISESLHIANPLDEVEGFVLSKRYKYGKIAVDVYR